MKSTRRAAILMAAMFATACSSSSNDPGVAPPSPPAPQTLKLQVLHASPDAPAVNVLINGTEQLSGVDYKVGSGFIDVNEGSYEIQVDGIVPGGTATVIGPASFDLSADTIYSVIAVGDVAGIEPLIITQDDTAIPAGSTRIRVVHAAPMAPAVDVYATAPGADLAASAPLGSFAFKGDLGPVDVTAGDYQIRVTLAGDPATVVYDSGTVAIPADANLLITAVENTTTGASPISLSLLDGTGSSEILDASTPASLRVVHGSPDAPAVDVIANDNFAMPLVSELAFPAFTDFLDVPSADYNVKVTPAGDAGTIVIDADLSLAAGERYTVLAIDNLASIAPLVVADDPRPLATAAKVRIIHGSPAAGNVDIYVTAEGADIAQETALLTDIPFAANTGFLEVDAGTYDISVAPTGTTTVAIGATIAVDAGGIYTAVARDATGGGAPLGLILLDDFQ